MAKMEYSKEVFDELMRVVYDNVLGWDMLDRGDYEEQYSEEIEDGELPTYKDFCELRDRFFNRDMSIEEAIVFLQLIS